MPQIEVPRNKPLLLVDNDNEIKSIFEEFSEAMSPLNIENHRLLERHKEISKEAAQIHRKYWGQIEKLLVERGLIDDTKVALFLRDGVVYMGHESNPLDEILDRILNIRENIEDDDGPGPGIQLH